MNRAILEMLMIVRIVDLYHSFWSTFNVRQQSVNTPLDCQLTCYFIDADDEAHDENKDIKS